MAKRKPKPPDCPICHKPMSSQGIGYCQDRGQDVELFYCRSDQNPTGCWTQFRRNVKEARSCR